MRAKAVFFDAGGTLVHPNWDRISAVAGAHGARVEAVRLREIARDLQRSFDHPSHLRMAGDRARSLAYFGRILAGCGAEDGRLAAVVEAVLAEHAERNLWDAVPEEVPGALARLAGRRKAVVSNANGTVRMMLARLGLADHFELIVDSFEVGVEKPDPRIFRIALDRLGLGPGEAWYVGDFYHVDVVGARAAGIDPVLIDPHGLYGDADCPRVKSLGEFADLVLAG